MSSVSIPEMTDGTLEGNETFSITLSFEIPSSITKGITSGDRYSAVVIITDSTSECCSSMHI